MSYHNAYNHTPHPTMYGNNLNNNLMTMIATVPSRGYSRIWAFEDSLFDTTGKFEFTLNDGTGVGNYTFVDGVLLANRHAFEYNYEYEDMDVFEKKQFSLKLRVSTDITGAARRYSVFCRGDTGFRFECMGGQFSFVLWDTEGVMLDATESGIRSTYDTVITQMNEIVYTFNADSGVCKLYINGKYRTSYTDVRNNPLYFDISVATQGIRLNKV